MRRKLDETRETYVYKEQELNKMKVIENVKRIMLNSMYRQKLRE